MSAGSLQRPVGEREDAVREGVPRTGPAGDRSRSVIPTDKNPADPAPVRRAGLPYHAFVDGLRAVAILAVVGYHVGLPGFSGGFVGVDVFFVISGYLIIGQLVDSLGNGALSFGDFWARRVLRILPPFLLVLFACLIIGPIFFAVPAEFRQLGRETSFAALMIVNHHFLASQGYFDTAADLKPLLHLWTLAVEEQFYVVAPLLIFATFRLAKRLRWPVRGAWSFVALVLLSASFAGCVIFSMNGSNVAFYLMPFRAWEFIVGALAGFAPVVLRRWPGWALELVAVAGLLAIAAAVCLFDDKVVYPSYPSLLPVAGAALIIAVGLAAPRTRVTRGLALPPMVGIGLISYAWYLWHWPTLSFVRTFNLGERSMPWDGMAAVVALVAAAATYFLVERPIRRWRRAHLNRLSAWSIVAVGIVAALLVAGAGLDFETRVAAKVAAAIPTSLLPPAVTPVLPPGDCVLDADKPLDPACLQPSRAESFGLLFGDSHARVAYRKLREKARVLGSDFAVKWGSGCPPLLDTTVFANGGKSRGCMAGLVAAFGRVRASLAGRLDFVVFDARWNLHVGLKRTDPTNEPIRQIAAPAMDAPAVDQYALLTDRLRHTIDLLESLGAKRILVIAPEPEFTHYATDCVLHADRYGRSRDACSLPRAAVEARRARTVAALRAAVANRASARLIDPLDLFCDRSICRPYDGNTLLYADDDHLSDAGIEREYQAFRGDFDWVFKGGAE